MKFLEYIFTILIIIGLFLLLMGLVGTHSHFNIRSNLMDNLFIFALPIIGIAGLMWLSSKQSKLESHSFKSEIAQKAEFRQLQSLLYQALIFTNQRSMGNDRSFVSKLQESVRELSNLNFNEIENLWVWFAPTGKWDDFAGAEGADLGNEIFEAIEKVRKLL